MLLIFNELNFLHPFWEQKCISADLCVQDAAEVCGISQPKLEMAVLSCWCVNVLSVQCQMNNCAAAAAGDAYFLRNYKNLLNHVNIYWMIWKIIQKL